MNLREQINRIHSMMGVISEDKRTTLINNEFDELFDTLKLIKTQPDIYQYNWLSKNGKKIFERNHWGMLWIYGCNEFLNIYYLKDIFSLSEDEFKTQLLDYLNEKYGDEFGKKPLKSISSENCDDYFNI